MVAEVSLIDAEKKDKAEIFRLLGSADGGLSDREAAHRLRTLGPNSFGAKKKAEPLRIFISKFKNPVMLMLLVAAVVSGFLGSSFDSLTIIVIVFASALIDFLNTYKSERAAEKLQERVNITTAVLRGGKLEERRIDDVVPGDIVSLSAGDIVSADAILLDAKDLFINESTLTGESLPVEKEANQAGLRTVYMGTSVVSGKATAIAVATGLRTKLGAIAGHLATPDAQTEFEKNLKDFSFFIFRITLFLVLAIILLNVLFEQKGFLNIFLFAVAIAVGLTPELLPMIVTTNLAKGALKMSKHGVIVKKLSAIHNFGSIDVLCTDKTGTLTEDKIALIKHVDGLGNENKDVLFWGYLSSSYLTSVRGSLDQAVREFGKMDIAGWDKVDEIPFDFERKMESVVVEHGKGGTTVLIAKGAPEGIFKASKFYGGKKEPLHEALETKIKAEYERLSADGFRVLGIAVKHMPHREELYSKKDESDMSFLGFLAFLDPPKHAVKSVLEKLALHNVAVKIITGDNLLVTEKIAKELDLKITGHLSGDDIARLHEEELARKVEEVNIFTRVEPEQKEHIIRALRKNGHVVGYIGDGVNDLLSLKEADVGISVDNAVDVAKESADIILLKKGLMEVFNGVIEGRRTFANTFKYLMMALSSNFGNMFSMPAASLFIPFLPMTPTQILLNNFLYDGSQFSIPFDNVDESFLRRAKKFDLDFMRRFMLVFGLLSSVFDIITFLMLFYYAKLTGSAFQTGWFLESLATQTLVVGIIRTRESIFRSKPSIFLVLGSAVTLGVGWFLPHTALAKALGFISPGGPILLVIAGIVLVYLLAVEAVKRMFYHRYGHLIER